MEVQVTFVLGPEQRAAIAHVVGKRQVSPEEYAYYLHCAALEAVQMVVDVRRAFGSVQEGGGHAHSPRQ